MAGFDNEVVYATNVDFSSGSPVTGKVTTDGQLLIGSTATPNIRVSVPTGSTGVVVTTGAGTLDFGTPTAVQGPNTALDGDIAVYSTGTGKLIRDSGVHIDPSGTHYGRITISQQAATGTGLVVSNGTNAAAAGSYVQLDALGGDSLINFNAFSRFQIGTVAGSTILTWTVNPTVGADNIIGGTTVMTMEITSGVNFGKGRFRTFGSQVVLRKAVPAHSAAMNNADYLVACTAVPQSITLPAIAGLVEGQTFRIKDESGDAAANNITITPADAVNINGSANYVISSNYGSVDIYYNGTQFYTL